MAFPVEEFVDAVRPHRFLYDRTQLDFKDVSKKEALWEIIGQQFGLSGHKAMNKWRNIRDKYYKVRKQEEVDRLKGLKRFRRGQTWTLFPKLDQILEQRRWNGGADTSGEGSSQAGVSPACGTFVSSSWVQANVDHVSFTSGLASLEAMLQDESGGPIPQVKQEPPEPLEMIISEEQDAASCHEEAVDSEREDEIAMEAIEHSIAIAKQVFQRRKGEFREAVRRLASDNGDVTSGGAVSCDVTSSGPRLDAETQTESSGARPADDVNAVRDRGAGGVGVTANDGLDHFGLFVAQRLRTLEGSPHQAPLMAAILKLVCEPFSSSSITS
uniref:Putative alcohol dehydrogenase transcription factor myb/sant-like protein n=1 Tax=Ixodes ricinus TaxID=34613 RepID=A0A147BDS0_IXORI